MKNKNIKLSAAILAISMSLGGCKLSDLANADIDPALPVAPELVAKHSADYTGTGAGSISIDGRDGQSRVSDIDVTTNLSANFDEGTVGGRFVANFLGNNGTEENIVPGVFHQTAIEGTGFSGRTSLGNPNSDVTLSAQTGTYSGAFNADGTALTGAAEGGGSFTDPTGGGTYSYDFDFNGTEVTP